MHDSATRMNDLRRYYHLLELEVGASWEDVDSAYRDLAFVWHPDRIPDDRERLKQKAHTKLQELNEARQFFRSYFRQRVKGSQSSSPQDREDSPSDKRSSFYRKPASKKHPFAKSGTRWTGRSPFVRTPFQKKESASATQSPTFKHPPNPTNTEDKPSPSSSNNAADGATPFSKKPSPTPTPSPIESWRERIRSQSPSPQQVHRRPGVDLSGSDFRGADLREKDFSGRNLSGSDLSGADLSDAFLHQVNLSGANLKGAKLFRANLLQADLSGANLAGANLVSADLSGANLCNANLAGARMRVAGRLVVKLTGANLDGAIVPQ